MESVAKADEKMHLQKPTEVQKMPLKMPKSH
jgi:hypothetical protein